MFQSNGSSIECATCVGGGTSACADCVVTFVLANDAGPIEYIPAPVSLRHPTHSSSIDRAVALFAGAGMLTEPVVFVPVDEFESIQNCTERVLHN